MPETTLVRTGVPARPRHGGTGALHVAPALWAPAPQVGSPFRPSRTEPARRVRALVEALAASGDPQTVVTSMTPPRRLRDDRPGAVRVLAVRARGWGDLPLARTVAAVTSLAGSVDVIHLHLLPAGSLVTLRAIVAAVRRRPIVVHFNESRAVPLRTGRTASWRSRLVDAVVEGRVLTAADMVVAPSARLAEVAQQAGASRVAVVPPAALPVGEAGGTPPLGGLGTGRRVVAVGPLTARRRPEALVRALAVQPPDTHLFLLGRGPRQLEVDRETRRLGLEGRVHVIPTVTWQDVTDHVAHADVVATASLSGEDVTVPLLAMTAGRPTVSTAVEGLPAVVSDGLDGLLVAPGDDEALAGAIREVLTDSRRAASLGASARRRAVAFDWVSCAARVRSLVAGLTDVRA